MGRATVLERYQRLESEGIWRADPEAQRRDVIVSIGEATLTITDLNERVLAHWSLPALHRRNPGERPAIYTPGADAPDHVEIHDGEMIDALERVAKAIRRGQARPGRLRASGLLIVGALILVLGLFWLPGALTRYTASILPDVAQDRIGAELLGEVERLAGAPCADEAGLRALGLLERRMFPDGDRRLFVIPSALAGTAHLPGGRILIDHRLAEDHETPGPLVAAIRAADSEIETGRQMERVLNDLGLGASLRLLTTGALPERALGRHAENLIARSAPRPAAEAEDTDSLLSDGEWIALQQICED